MSNNEFHHFEAFLDLMHRTRFLYTKEEGFLPKIHDANFMLAMLIFKEWDVDATIKRLGFKESELAPKLDLKEVFNMGCDEDFPVAFALALNEEGENYVIPPNPFEKNPELTP